jgi:hypothetical protein
MEFAGYPAEDAPDPRVARLELIRGLGVPVAGLIPQRHLEERGEAGCSASRPSGAAGPDELTIGRTYLLWRNPEDHDDPVNLADLDETTRATVAAPLDRPIPAWLHEARFMLRYPRLWEAVRTHWVRPGGERRSVEDRLIEHAEHVLANSFREQLGLEAMEWAPPIRPTALQPSPVVVDGTMWEGLLLDTDPFVAGLGVELDDGRVVTVVVPRDELPFLTLELASDLPV